VISYEGIKGRDQKEIGELVYFKRANNDRWRGPGVVSDSVKRQFSVQMGRDFYPCRHEDLLRLNDEEQRAFKEQNRNLSHDNEKGHTETINNIIEEENKIIVETEFITLQGNEAEVVSHSGQPSREQESIDPFSESSAATGVASSSRSSQVTTNPSSERSAATGVVSSIGSTQANENTVQSLDSRQNRMLDWTIMR